MNNRFWRRGTSPVPLGDYLRRTGRLGCGEWRTEDVFSKRLRGRHLRRGLPDTGVGRGRRATAESLEVNTLIGRYTGGRVSSVGTRHRTIHTVTVQYLLMEITPDYYRYNEGKQSGRYHTTIGNAKLKRKRINVFQQTFTPDSVKYAYNPSTYRRRHFLGKVREWVDKLIR